MPKVTLGITGLPEILGRDYGIEKPYWGPSNLLCHCLFVNYEDGQYSSIGDSGRMRRHVELFRDDESVATVGMCSLHKRRASLLC